MELDGYCPELNLAFEHQGRHHHEITRYTQTAEHLEKRRGDDCRKRLLCAERGIALIEIPEIPEILPLDVVRVYLRTELEKRGVNLPVDFDSKPVDFREAFGPPGSRSRRKVKGGPTPTSAESPA